MRQGDIIQLDFDPQSGHEQASFCPAVVISNDFFNIKTNMAIVCPITNTSKPFPLHIPLDKRTTTTGVVLCEHVKAVDVNARNGRVIERIPDDLLREIVATVISEVEQC